MKIKKLRFIEFLLMGVFVGIVEDLIAIHFATDAHIDIRTIMIVFLVALPFAFLSEIIVDHPRFWELFFKKEK